MGIIIQGVAASNRGMNFRINPWTPANISTALWFDASDTTTVIQTGNLVSQWNDKSGNNRHISQATPSQQPTLASNQQNGLNVLTFDGSNDILSNASVGASGLNSVTIISVFRMISGGSTEDIPMGIGTNTNGNLRSYYRGPNDTTVGFAGWNNDVPSSAYSYDIGGGYHIFEVWNPQLNTPNNAVIGRDGSTTTYTTNIGNLNTSGNGFSVGSLQGTSTYYTNMSVGEILVFYSVLTDVNRQLAEGYLAWKWGLQGNLPANHPYRNVSP
jgi:hypothetical protein